MLSAYSADIKEDFEAYDGKTLQAAGLWGLSPYPMKGRHGIRLLSALLPAQPFVKCIQCNLHANGN